MKNKGKIGFIGGGNMAEAILRGILVADVSPEEVLVAEPLDARRDFLSATYGIAVTADNNQVVAGSDIIILAIKPQMAAEVVGAFANQFTADKLLISILAGTSTAKLEALLNVAAKVVRVMPNTPALIGCGAAALCSGQYAGDAELETARKIFAAVGSVVTVKETQMDAVTAVSGSGPAYVFTVIEALVAGGVAEGLDRETALALAVRTVEGAARLVAESGEEPAELRRKVCSPGGTTLAAIEKLDAGGFGDLLVAAVRRAAERSRELG